MDGLGWKPFLVFSETNPVGGINRLKGLKYIRNLWLPKTLIIEREPIPPLDDPIWASNAQTADVGWARSETAVELPILPLIVPF